MRCRTRSPSPCASGRGTACRPTRAPGSRRPPATAPSTACAASRVDENCRARRRCFRRTTTIPARPERRAPCRTTGFASSSPAATRPSPRRRRWRSLSACSAARQPRRSRGRFLVTEPAMAQRLARAKRKIKAARIPYRVPEEHELPDRLRPVLAVVYLVYNTGLTSTTDPDLCSEAIRLARILATLMPDEPEVAGLLALLLLTESRRASRTRPDGSLVLLSEQDRRRWARALIEEGQAIVRQSLRRSQPGASQPQALINAEHP